MVFFFCFFFPHLLGIGEMGGGVRVWPGQHSSWVFFGVQLFWVLLGEGCAYHYENTPIQIYRKFHLQKLKIFR